MQDWFSIEKIDDDTFAISEYRHWEETHCYLLIGTERAVLIDTGLGVADISKVVNNITLLPVSVITTHVHWDHIGGHEHFENFAVHEKEVKWISEEFPVPIQTVKRNLTVKPCDFPIDFDVETYSIFKGKPDSILTDGQMIDLGKRKIEVIHTPGHSPGHCCFYEAARGYLYSGDLIYTGCLDAFYPSTNPVEFMNSVSKIMKREIKRILPAHHQLNIPAYLADNVFEAFGILYDHNGLKQGSGVFDFGRFQIHI